MHRRHARYMPSATLVAAVVLAGYFLVVYRPLARRGQEANLPLLGAWARLVATNVASVACAGLELGTFEARLGEIRTSATNLAASARLVRDRIRPEPELQARLSEIFVLNDFEIERGVLVETLTRLAKKSKVGLGPSVLDGLPVHSVDASQPNLLWARLHQSEQLVRTAIASRVSAIRDLVQLPAVSHRGVDATELSLEELPLRIELVAPMEALARFLTSLPLRGPDLTVIGLPESLTNKPVLFVDRLMLRKFAPDRPGEVLADLRLSGFAPIRGPDPRPPEE